MKKPYILLILSGLLILSLISNNSNVIFAQTPNSFEDKATKRLEFLEKIKNQLQLAQRDYTNVSSNVKDTQEKLNEVQEKVLSLDAQIENLDKHILNSENLTLNVLAQITEKENNLKYRYEQAEIRDILIENQKQILNEYLTLLYKQENDFTDTVHGNDEINIVKLLLADQSAAQALQELKYFNILEESGREIFTKLEGLLEQEKIDKLEIENTRNKLVLLYRKLEQEKTNLEQQRAYKDELLEETKGREEIYQDLLVESKMQQAQTLNDIKSLRDNLDFIKQKINELGDNFNPKDFANVIDEKTVSVYDFINSSKEAKFNPKWPVSPARGISAYFHDESYRRAFGVGHNAIDIRVPQQTVIHAVDDAVVSKAKDNGNGYSYIILAHKGGFMTVYGHIYEIRVREGQEVKQGQIIGLSGGIPGTKGAGLMTTGAHLHFEMLKGGKHVDPLDYLPLSLLPFDSLPQKYLEKITGDPQKIKRTIDDFNSDEEILESIEEGGHLETLEHVHGQDE